MGDHARIPLSGKPPYPTVIFAFPSTGVRDSPEDITMDAKGFVVLPGQGPVWEMAPGRSAAFKMQRGETGENVMMFEEATPAGTVTPYHLHHDSDEITYVLSGQMPSRSAMRSRSAGLEQAPSCRVASLMPGRTQGWKPVEHCLCSRRARRARFSRT